MFVINKYTTDSLFKKIENSTLVTIDNDCAINKFNETALSVTINILDTIGVTNDKMFTFKSINDLLNDKYFKDIIINNKSFEDSFGNIIDFAYTDHCYLCVYMVKYTDKEVKYCVSLTLDKVTECVSYGK